MKAYLYHRKIGPNEWAKEWSYKLPARLRELPKTAWPVGFTFNGTLWTSKARSEEYINQKIQEALKASHEIRMGRMPANLGDIRTYKARYMDWGRVQGGTRGEMGWSKGHASHIDEYLDKWFERLSIKAPADIRQPEFRREVVRMLSKDKLAPNTVNHWARTLTGFCKWMVEENLLPMIPIRHKTLDRTPLKERGVYQPSEISAIISVAPFQRAIIYHTAYVTSYRKTSLSKIKVGYLDWVGLTIGLDHLSAKNRKKTTKPMPPKLAALLYPLCQGKGPEDFLFDWFNPKQAVKWLRKDMIKAGVSIRDTQGRVRDFHSIKGSYGTALDVLGTDTKIMQQALDHATFKQTLAYLRRDLAPMRAAAEEVENGLKLTPQQPPKKNYNQGITEDDAEQKVVYNSTTYGEAVGFPHPPPPFPQSPANPKQTSVTLNQSKYATLETLPQTSYEEAQEILSRLYHRISEPGFLEALRALSETPTDHIPKFSSLLKAASRQGAA